MKIGGHKVGGKLGKWTSQTADKYRGVDWTDPKTLAVGVASLYGGSALAANLGQTGTTMFQGTPAAIQTSSTGLGISAGLFAAGAPAPYKIPGDDVGNAPTIDETNDPNLPAQFRRMRAAARALGRAGTIKAKGTTLGGDPSALGAGLTLQGV